MLFDGFQVLFHRVVDADVDDLKARAFHHHADQVFTDVVDVALDGADHHLADRLDAGFGQQGAQHFHAAFHGVGRQQDLRHEQNAVAEINAHDAHAFDQSVVEHAVGGPAAAEQDVGGLDHLFTQTVVEVIVHLFGQLFIVERVEVQVVVEVFCHVHSSG